MVTKEDSLKLFNQLNPNEKQIVVNTLMKTRRDYDLSRITTDVPYFFWSVNKVLFEGIDPTEYLAIETAEDFASQTIFYISKFILDKRGTNGV